MLTLLPLAFLSAPCFWQAPADEAPSVMRVYDLRSALPYSLPERSIVLLPLSRDCEGHRTSREEEESADASQIVSFLRALDPAQWEYEGREMYLSENHQLRVTAPAALQDVVSRALTLLEETVARPMTIVVDIVTFGPNPGVSTLPPLLPATEVARWTAIGSGHESYELTLHPGELGTQRAERMVSFVLGSEPEIAERAAALNISPERVAVGTTIDCAVAPGIAGSWLSFVLRNGRFLDTDLTRDALLRSATTHDQATEIATLQKTRSDPHLANHSLSINAFLPDGKALVFVTSAGLESRVVFVRQASPTPALTVPLPEELRRVTNRNATVLVRTDAVNVPIAYGARGDGPARLDSLDVLCDPSQTEPLVLAQIQRTTRVEVYEAFRKFVDEYEVIELGPFLAVCGPEREPIEKAVAKFIQAAPLPQSLAVTMTLRRGTRDGAPLARAVVPLRAGAASTVVLGRESVADLKASVHIAQGVSVTYAGVGRLFDGLCVAMTAYPTIGGGLTLDLDAHGRWSRSQPREHEAGGSTTPRVQLPDADLLDVRRSVVFAKADGGPRKITLGNAGTSSEALTLDFEVVDLR